MPSMLAYAGAYERSIVVKEGKHLKASSTYFAPVASSLFDLLFSQTFIRHLRKEVIWHQYK